MTKYKLFYYDAQPEYYAQLTEGMSDEMKKGFANALAHGMMPLKRTDKGVWLTRSDYLLPGEYYRPDKPHTSLVDNEGRWHYYMEYSE